MDACGGAIASPRRMTKPPRVAKLPSMTAFPPPDFTQPRFANSPDARFAPAPSDGVLPDGFFSTTNLPTFVRLNGAWRPPREPRMDSAILLDANGELWVREGRRVRKGDMIAIAESEDGAEGIFVQTELIPEGGHEFTFMSSEVSRE